MRITNNTITYNFLVSLNKSMERQNKIQEQLSDGKAIHRPSDDPIKAMRSLRFGVSLGENEQFTQNLQDALSWMQTTDGAMSDLSTIMIRAKELLVSADGTKPIDALNAIGKEIDGLINQAVNIGNTKIGDRYIFAGQMDKTKPFERRTITDPASQKTMDVVVYNGDNNKISMPIQPGAVNPNQDSVNLTGLNVFGPQTTNYGQPTVDILNQLIQIKEELMQTSPVKQTSGAAGGATIGGTYTGTGYQSFDVRINAVAAGQVTGASYSLDNGNNWIGAAVVAGNPSVVTLPNGVNLSIDANAGNTVNGVYSFHVPQGGAPDVDWLSNVGLSYIETNHNRLLQAQTELGTRVSMYELTENMMSNNNIIITSDISANEDLDVSRAIIDFKTSENVYRTALSVGARIMPPSLVDFLK